MHEPRNPVTTFYLTKGHPCRFQVHLQVRTPSFDSSEGHTWPGMAKNRDCNLTGGNLALYFFFFLVGIAAAAELSPSVSADDELTTITVTF